MQKDELAGCLRREVDTWSEKSFGALLRELEKPVLYKSETQGSAYRVEVQILEITEQYVHVMVSVDDMSLFRSIKPLSATFLVYRDGRIDK